MTSLAEFVRTFIWEFLGYVVPGFFCLVVYDSSVGLSTIAIGFKGDWLFGTFPVAVTVVISYALGFILYALSSTKDKLIKSWARQYSKFGVEEKLAEDPLVKDVLLDYSKRYKVSNVNLHTVRNLILTERPEIDEKTYRFMFRSDFFNHLSTISLFVFLGNVISLVLECICQGYTTLALTLNPFLILSIVIFWPLHLMALIFYRRALTIPLYHGMINVNK